MPPGKTNNFFGIKVSKGGIPVNNASDKQLIYKDDFSTKTYFDLTNSRMVEGLLPDGNYGLWVSKPGFDVTTASAEQLIFNSNQNIFKIVGSSTITIPAYNMTPGQLVWDYRVIPHGLPYIPVLQAYALVDQFFNAGPSPTINLITIRSYVPMPFDGGAGLALAGDIDIYGLTLGVDATNVYFGWTYLTSSTGAGYNFPAVPVKYDLLQESAN